MKIAVIGYGNVGRKKPGKPYSPYSLNLPAFF